MAASSLPECAGVVGAQYRHRNTWMAFGVDSLTVFTAPQWLCGVDMCVCVPCGCAVCTVTQMEDNDARDVRNAEDSCSKRTSPTKCMTDWCPGKCRLSLSLSLSPADVSVALARKHPTLTLDYRNSSFNLRIHTYKNAQPHDSDK